LTTTGDGAGAGAPIGIPRDAVTIDASACGSTRPAKPRAAMAACSAAARTGA
jgi:hypothetical protein